MGENLYQVDNTTALPPSRKHISAIGLYATVFLYVNQRDLVITPEVVERLETCIREIQQLLKQHA